MPGRPPSSSHDTAVAKAGDLRPIASAARKELEKILASDAFQSSKRSQEFLAFVVDRALAGEFHSLKERTIGCELFGRPADYDTQGDAIVRVVATDVRRRLAQYYSNGGRADSLHITLPTGIYIPEFTPATSPGAAPLPAHVEAPPPVPDQRTGAPSARGLKIWRGAALVLLALSLALGYRLAVLEQARSETPLAAAAPLPLPWSALVRKGATTDIVVPDASVNAIQLGLDYKLTLSDYIKRSFLPPQPLSPDAALMVKRILWTQYVSFGDASAAVKMQMLTRAHGGSANLRFARDLAFRDLNSPVARVFVGASRGNFWSHTLRDELNFFIDYDVDARAVRVFNRNPRPGEQPRYAPNALNADDTGTAYAMIAFLPPQDQHAARLLVAGTNEAAPEGAASLATDLERLPKELRAIGVDPFGQPRYFELLLEIKTVGGAPAVSTVIASRTSRESN